MRLHFSLMHEGALQRFFQNALRIKIFALALAAVWLSFDGTRALSANTKEVLIRWEAVPFATQYEVRVFDSSQVSLLSPPAEAEVKRFILKPSEEKIQKLEVELTPGAYAYQLRTFDRLKRAGDWSAAQALFVKPKPFESITPKDGAELVHYSVRAPLILKWEPSAGASGYEIELRDRKGKLLKQQVQKPEATWRGLSPGEYEWRVTAVYELLQKNWLSLEKRWRHEQSEWRELEVRLEKLQQPIAVYPIQKIAPPKEKKIKFRWKKVEGAQSYLLRISKAGSRLPASIGTFEVSDTEKEVTLSDSGEYSWSAQAIAYTEDADAKTLSSESRAQFKIDPNADYFEGSGFVALSSMVAPYSYVFQSPSTGSGGTQDSIALTTRLSGEYYFHPIFGAGLGAEGTAFSVDGKMYLRKSVEAQIKARIAFGPVKRTWVIAPKVGFEGRDYIGLYRRNRVTSTLDSFALGPTLGLDFRKQILDQLSVGVRFNYFLPVALSGEGIDSITSQSSYRNWSLGVQGLYWLSKRWGVGLGAFIEKRSISYSISGRTELAPENYSMDGNYFFGSLIFSFGR